MEELLLYYLSLFLSQYLIILENKGRFIKYIMSGKNMVKTLLSSMIRSNISIPLPLNPFNLFRRFQYRDYSLLVS